MAETWLNSLTNPGTNQLYDDLNGLYFYYAIKDSTPENRVLFVNAMRVLGVNVLPALSGKKPVDSTSAFNTMQALINTGIVDSTGSQQSFSILMHLGQVVKPFVSLAAANNEELPEVPVGEFKAASNSSELLAVTDLVLGLMAEKYSQQVEAIRGLLNKKFRTAYARIQQARNEEELKAATEEFTKALPSRENLAKAAVSFPAISSPLELVPVLGLTTPEQTVRLIAADKGLSALLPEQQANNVNLSELLAVAEGSSSLADLVVEHGEGNLAEAAKILRNLRITSSDYLSLINDLIAKTQDKSQQDALKTAITKIEETAKELSDQGFNPSEGMGISNLRKIAKDLNLDINKLIIMAVNGRTDELGSSAKKSSRSLSRRPVPVGPTSWEMPELISPLSEQQKDVPPAWARDKHRKLNHGMPGTEPKPWAPTNNDRKAQSPRAEVKAPVAPVTAAPGLPTAQIEVSGQIININGATAEEVEGISKLISGGLNGINAITITRDTDQAPLSLINGTLYLHNWTLDLLTQAMNQGKGNNSENGKKIRNAVRMALDGRISPHARRAAVDRLSGWVSVVEPQAAAEGTYKEVFEEIVAPVLGAKTEENQDGISKAEQGQASVEFAAILGITGVAVALPIIFGAGGLIGSALLVGGGLAGLGGWLIKNRLQMPRRVPVPQIVSKTPSADKLKDNNRTIVSSKLTSVGVTVKVSSTDGTDIYAFSRGKVNLGAVIVTLNPDNRLELNMVAIDEEAIARTITDQDPETIRFDIGDAIRWALKNDLIQQHGGRDFFADDTRPGIDRWLSRRLGFENVQSVPSAKFPGKIYVTGRIPAANNPTTSSNTPAPEPVRGQSPATAPVTGQNNGVRTVGSVFTTVGSQSGSGIVPLLAILNLNQLTTQLIPLNGVKHIGIGVSTYGGLAPPAWFTNLHFSSTEVVVAGVIVVLVAVVIALAVRSIRGAQSAASRTGEDGQGARTASSNKIGNTDSEAMSDNSNRSNIAGKTSRITGWASANAEENNKVGVKVLVVRIKAFVAVSKAAADQYRAAVVNYGTRGAAKIVKIIANIQGSIRAYSFRNWFINVLKKNNTVIPLIHSHGRLKGSPVEIILFSSILIPFQGEFPTKFGEFLAFCCNDLAHILRGVRKEEDPVKNLIHILTCLQAQILFRKEKEAKVAVLSAEEEKANYDASTPKVKVALSNRLKENGGVYSEDRLVKWFNAANLPDKKLESMDIEDVEELLDKGLRRTAEFIVKLGRVNEFIIKEGGLTAQDVREIVKEQVRAELDPIIKQTAENAEELSATKEQLSATKEQLSATTEQQRFIVEAFGRKDDGIMKEADCFKSILLNVAAQFKDKF